MLFSHISTSRKSTILLGITSNNKYLQVHQAMANSCLNYGHLLTNIDESKAKKKKKPQSAFGMGTFIEQLLTDICCFFFFPKQCMHPTSKFCQLFSFHPSVAHRVNIVDLALIERQTFIFNSVVPNFVSVFVMQNRFEEEQQTPGIPLSLPSSLPACSLSFFPLYPNPPIHHCLPFLSFHFSKLQRLSFELVRYYTSHTVYSNLHFRFHGFCWLSQYFNSVITVFFV